MGSLKYKFGISKEKGMYIVPMAMVRFVQNTPFQYDGGLNFEWEDKLWIGAAYKSSYAVGANVGFCIHKQFSIGYSYDFIIGEIGEYSGMAHELMMNFKFGKRKEEPKADLEKEAAEKAANERRMDSLETEVQISQARLKQLSDKLDQQAKDLEAQKKNQQNIQNSIQNNQGSGNTSTNNTNPGNTNSANNTNPPQNTGGNPANSGNQNATIGESSPNKRFENGALIVSAKKAEFKDLNNQVPPKGYYVVIGTYFYRDLAQAEAQRFVAKGYKTTDWVYSGPKNFNYIFMFKLKTKEEALEKLKIAREAGVNDAWIQELTD
jgi:hypothetical protein